MIEALSDRATIAAAGQVLAAVGVRRGQGFG